MAGLNRVENTSTRLAARLGIALPADPLPSSQPAQLANAGVSITEVTDFLEVDGVKKFAAAWIDLLHSVEKARSA